MVLISLNFWKKLVMCAERACQMGVHMYQYTAGGVPVQCIIKYHVAKTTKICINLSRLYCSTSEWSYVPLAVSLSYTLDP